MRGNARRSISALRELSRKAELGKWTSVRDFETLQYEAIGLVAGALGARHPIVDRIEAMKSPGRLEATYMSMAGENPQMSRLQGLINSAIGALGDELHASDEIAAAAVDPELWEDIRGLYEASDWEKVPARVATFVEDHYRNWAGDPKSRDGGRLVGKNLYAVVLANESDLHLGSEKSEHEGWKSLAMGLAQAVGNVDRHRLQNRKDAHAYAVGVLGLGSLLLTQMRFEHGPRLKH